MVFCEMRRRGFASDIAFIVRLNCNYSKNTSINNLLGHNIHRHSVSRNINISFRSVPEPVDTVWIEVGFRIQIRKFDINYTHQKYSTLYHSNYKTGRGVDVIKKS
jgi:hypothetical protein